MYKAAHKNKQAFAPHLVNLPNAVRPVIGHLLTHGHPKIEHAAHALGLSVRSLQRQLAGLNTSYSKLVEEVRCKMACEFLKKNELPIFRIAERLGYSDCASFSRVFVNWQGISPRIYRNQNGRQHHGNQDPVR